MGFNPSEPYSLYPTGKLFHVLPAENRALKNVILNI